MNFILALQCIRWKNFDVVYFIVKYLGDNLISQKSHSRNRCCTRTFIVTSTWKLWACYETLVNKDYTDWLERFNRIPYFCCAFTTFAVEDIWDLSSEIEHRIPYDHASLARSKLKHYLTLFCGQFVTLSTNCSDDTSHKCHNSSRLQERLTISAYVSSQKPTDRWASCLGSIYFYRIWQAPRCRYIKRFFEIIC